MASLASDLTHVRLWNTVDECELLGSEIVWLGIGPIGMEDQVSSRRSILGPSHPADRIRIGLGDETCLRVSQKRRCFNDPSHLTDPCTRHEICQGDV